MSHIANNHLNEESAQNWSEPVGARNRSHRTRSCSATARSSSLETGAEAKKTAGSPKKRSGPSNPAPESVHPGASDSAAGKTKPTDKNATKSGSSVAEKRTPAKVPVPAAAVKGPPGNSSQTPEKNGQGSGKASRNLARRSSALDSSKTNPVSGAKVPHDVQPSSRLPLPPDHDDVVESSVRCGGCKSLFDSYLSLMEHVQDCQSSRHGSAPDTKTPEVFFTEQEPVQPRRKSGVDKKANRAKSSVPEPAFIDVKAQPIKKVVQKSSCSGTGLAKRGSRSVSVNGLPQTTPCFVAASKVSSKSCKSVCGICRVKFASDKRIFSHVVSDHLQPTEDPLSKCGFRDDIFVDQANLDDHVQKPHEVKKFYFLDFEHFHV